MTLRDFWSFGRRVARDGTALVYPPTRRKLHRLAHVAATVLTVASAAGVWLMSSVHWSARAGADLVLLVAYLAKWEVVVTRVDSAIDGLPIPEGDEATALRLVKNSDGDEKAR